MDRDGDHPRGRSGTNVTVDMIKATLATAPTYSATVLYQVEELLDRKPVRLPRWMLGGRFTCPEARGWAPYEVKRHQWFTLDASEVLRPA